MAIRGELPRGGLLAIVDSRKEEKAVSLIQALAATHPPRPGSEHDKIIRTTLAYLAAKQPYNLLPCTPG